MIEKAESGCSISSLVDVTTQLHTPETYETTSPAFNQHEQPTFAHSNSKPNLVIRKGYLTFEISNTISPSLLRLLGGMLNA